MSGKIVVITGPTATGKTALGVALAQKLGGEVVSADSMQIYRHMNIGTAKPTAEETRGVAHHMLDIIDPREAYSVSRYVEDASKCADDILARGGLPIVVGGTGLYIDSLVLGRTFAESENPALRREIEARYDALGGEALLAELAKIDAPSAEKLHANDKKRIVRALEIFALTGATIAEHNAKTLQAPARYSAARIALDFEERSALYSRIDARVDEMLARGFLDEAKGLLDMGVSPSATSMQAIGYREMCAAIEGEITLEEAAAQTKQRSRAYAKRQLTWLRARSDVRRIAWRASPEIPRAVEISTQYLREMSYIL